MHTPRGFSHSLIRGYLGGFHALTILNNAAQNKDVGVSLPQWAFNSSGYILKGGTAGS